MDLKPQGNSKSKKNLPETEVPETAKRRRFTADYKAKILRETDSAGSGEISAILRREGIYASYLQKWRIEREARQLVGKKRGPKTNPLTAENKKLKAENERLQKMLKQKDLLLELQKKVAEILNVKLDPTDEIE